MADGKLALCPGAGTETDPRRFTAWGFSQDPADREHRAVKK